jgi:LPS export ABC transporter protein LptC
MKNVLISIAVTFIFAMALPSCANDMETINKYIDTEVEPDLTAEKIELFYSDSARLQMKLSAPIVKDFNTANEKRREFPKGLHVWYYEKNGELKAEITANWAKHYIETDLWEAQSNVVVTNSEGRKLESEQLFWDPQKGIVYSEKYTKITNPDGTVATGNKFNAKQDFSEYELLRGKATIVLKDEEKTETGIAN